ncbi:hypothetical protein GCM10007036_13990 [Alsobacter metallidurans]|uniref:Uncharacterized protein n=1 Tax=Alsobacter metallidurans TaxID=340221 RepID=A0A917MHF5_9HYPH|nr:hypothetical protein [Alsobacter metallidurans]GGH14579.1 hypothetical protein GCM10007036_13990 [Alsobacter metallidurans]
MSFFGPTTFTPRTKDIARHADVVRDIERKSGRDAALRVATAAMEGMAAWIITAVGPRECLAVLDRIKTDLINSTRS